MKNIFTYFALTISIFITHTTFANSNITLEGDDLLVTLDESTTRLKSSIIKAQIPDVTNGTKLRLFSHNLAVGDGSERYNSHSQPDILERASAFCASLGHGNAISSLSTKNTEDDYLIEVTMKSNFSYTKGSTSITFPKKLIPGLPYTKELRESEAFSDAKPDVLLKYERIPQYFSNIVCSPSATSEED